MYLEIASPGRDFSYYPVQFLGPWLEWALKVPRLEPPPLSQFLNLFQSTQQPSPTLLVLFSF